MAEKLNLKGPDNLIFYVGKLACTDQVMAVGEEDGCSIFTKVTLIKGGPQFSEGEKEKLRALKEALTKALEILDS